MIPENTSLLAWNGLVEKCKKYAEDGKDPEDLVALLSSISTYLENHLMLLGERFSQGLMIQLLVNELMRYLIEDDYIQFDHYHQQVKKSLLELLKDDNWLAPSIKELLQALWNIANSRIDFPRRFALLANGLPQAEFLFNQPGQQDFLVSSRRFPFETILEWSLTNPIYADKIGSRFFNKLKYLRNNVEVKSLCFIEKVYGPIGALGLLSYLVKESNLPASIYREGYWYKKDTRFVGYQPKPNDEVCIIYDSLVTGGAILNASSFIEENYKAKVVGAIVFFEYDKDREARERIKDKGIHLEVIENYKDHESEIDALASGYLDRTENFIPIQSDDSYNPEWAKEFLESSEWSKGGEEIVTIETEEALSEVHRIEFASDEDLKFGLHEIFGNDYPFEMTPYGIFELPKWVIDKLKEKDINFHEMKAIPIHNLSPLEIKKIKEENQHIVFTKK